MMVILIILVQYNGVKRFHSRYDIYLHRPASKKVTTFQPLWFTTRQPHYCSGVSLPQSDSVQCNRGWAQLITCARPNARPCALSHDPDPVKLVCVPPLVSIQACWCVCTCACQGPGNTTDRPKNSVGANRQRANSGGQRNNEKNGSKGSEASTRRITGLAKWDWDKTQFVDSWMSINYAHTIWTVQTDEKQTWLTCSNVLVCLWGFPSCCFVCLRISACRYMGRWASLREQ